MLKVKKDYPINNMERIYVMIPSLYDYDVKKTILNCISNAKHPERISFGISLQGLDNIHLEDIPNEKRILILDKNVVYGIGKTRFFLQQMNCNEDYFLSIDCHTNFDNHWDETLINKYKEINDPMAVISQPLTPELNHKYYKARYVYDDVAIFPIRYQFSNSDNLDPILNFNLSNFLCSHFIFGSNKFFKIQYPSYFYWDVQDALLSIKLFCHGFNIYELERVPISTTPKDMEACNDRSAWFHTALNQYTDKYPIKFDYPYNFIGERINIEYEYDNLHLSNHLLTFDKSLEIDINLGVLEILRDGHSNIIKENFLGLSRTTKDFFDFFNISQNEIDITINRIKEWIRK
jgi:hypothetical protein